MHQILPSGKLLVDGVVAVGELGEVADVLEHVSVMQQPMSVHRERGKMHRDRERGKMHREMHHV